MKFKKYFMSLTVQERELFAKNCDTSRQHLTNIAYGLKPCGEALAINIDRESRGRVKCESLRPDVDYPYLRETGKEAA